MALFKHFSDVQDTDRIVRDVYPVLLQLLSHQVDAVIEWNYKEDYLYLTHQWAYEIPGHQSGNALSFHTFKSLIHPEDYPEMEKFFNRFIESSEIVFHHKCRFVFPDNQIVYAELMTSYLRDESGNPEKFIGLIKDYTSMQHANEEVKGLTLAIENAMSGIAWLDKEGIFQMVRSDYAKMLGYKPEELVGQSYVITVEETDKGLAYEGYLRMLKDGKCDIDLVAIRKDKTTFSKNILMIKTFDQAGKHNGHYCMMKDISGQVNYERAIRKQNEELRKVNQELDNLVYRVSHDLRSPIASSLGLAQLINKSLQIDEIRNYAFLQQKSLRKLDGLIKDILNYSLNSRKEIANDKIELKAFIQRLVSAEAIHHPDVRIDIQIDILGFFHSDQERLGIVLKNMIANAFQFQDAYKKQKYIKIYATSTNSTTRIQLEDNGIGIETQFQNKIFEMFFRGHEKSQGAGLGLYIARETVAKLGGHIAVESIFGEGSKFSIEIPSVLNRD